MGKTVTIPLGFDINNVDLGVCTLISGRTYNFRSLFPDDIPPVLEIATNNVGIMCISDNINKWAHYKPTRVAIQTQAYHFHGMQFDNDGNLQYMKPRGGFSEPYCPDHFIGYNHNAVVPGSSNSLLIRSFETDGTYNFQFNINLPEFDLREIIPSATPTITHVHYTTGGSYSILEITDNMVSQGYIPIPVSHYVSGQHTFFTLTVYLGNDTDFDYNFPNAGGGVLSYNIQFYNVSAVTITGTRFNVFGESARIELDWDQRSGVMGHDLQRSVGDFEHTPSYTTIYTGNDPEYTDTDLTEFKEHVYRVRVDIMDLGWTDWSNEVRIFHNPNEYTDEQGNPL